MTQKPHGVRPFPSWKERPMPAAVSTHSLTHQRAGDRWNRRSFSLPVFPEPSQPKSPKSNHLLIYRFLGRAARYKVTPFWSRREAKKGRKKKKKKGKPDKLKSLSQAIIDPNPTRCTYASRRSPPPSPWSTLGNPTRYHGRRLCGRRRLRRAWASASVWPWPVSRAAAPCFCWLSGG